ncbi:hypothetical protein [Kutzneria chonburiensis]|uniref:Uncharacterized protein n=1 Tax=Kutzneria chonburiensis TaxID=1483604 RepID=A0ABV6MXM6_9PSEU|nr:hypothetical protein [Kutzneria chonburiensis]
MRTSVQIRGEEVIGDRSYAVHVRMDTDTSVAVEVEAQLPSGDVVAEGSIILPVTDLIPAIQLIEATLQGLATTRGGARSSSRSRPAPANAGAPWPAEQDDELRRLWTDTATSIPELATHFARSRAAIKARLLHLNLSPDAPDRTPQKITNS